MEKDVLVEAKATPCLARDERVMRNGGVSPRDVAELSFARFYGVEVSSAVSSAGVHARAAERDPAYLRCACGISGDGFLLSTNVC